MKESSRFSNIVWMILWSLSFSVAMAMTKFIADHTSSVMIVFIRSLFGVALLAPLALKQGIKGVKTSHPFLYLFYVAFGTLAMICTYYAYSTLPFATAASIGFSGPFISIILAMFVLSEKVSLERWLFIILGYIGVLIIIQPGSLEFHPAMLVSLLANLFGGCALMTMKFLTKHENADKITFLSSCLRIIFLAFGVYFFWTTPSLYDCIFLTLIGLFGTFSQYCYIQAVKCNKISLVAPFEYTRLVFGVPLCFFLFAEVPGFWVFIGSLVIIASNFALTSVDRFKRAVKSSP